MSYTYHKDNVKTYSRQIAEITHTNPIVILLVVSNFEIYFLLKLISNFISIINDASTSLPSCIDGKMSRENATPAQWFQNSCFIS
ncbi:unnamed protein product [Rotaria sp. Silwood2]|nr:unnamed protein product [Rotaria sp. Silwood2]